MTAAIAWLRAHKQFALVAGAILAVFTSGYCAGKRSGSKPAVHEVVQGHAKADVNSQVDTTAHAGPWTVKTWEYGPSVDYVSAPVVGACAPGTRRRVVVAQDRVPTAAGADRAGEEGQQDAEHGDSVPPGQLIRYTEEEHGATTTETHAQAEVHEESTRKLDLTLTPTPRDWLQIQAGLEDVMHLSDPRIAARVRIFGSQWWLEGSTKPLTHCQDGRWCPTLGAALAKSF